jgi:hypothetical protein
LLSISVGNLIIMAVLLVIVGAAFGVAILALASASRGDNDEFPDDEDDLTE